MCPDVKQHLKDAQRFFFALFFEARPVSYAAGVLLERFVRATGDKGKDAFRVHLDSAPFNVDMADHPLVWAVGRIAMKLHTQDFDNEFADFNEILQRSDYDIDRIELAVLEALDWRIHVECPHHALSSLRHKPFGLTDDEYGLADAIVGKSPLLASRLAHTVGAPLSGVGVAIAAVAFVRTELAFDLEDTPDTPSTEPSGASAARKTIKLLAKQASAFDAIWAEQRALESTAQFVASLHTSFQAIITPEVRNGLKRIPSRPPSPPPKRLRAMPAPASQRCEYTVGIVTPPARRKRWVS